MIFPDSIYSNLIYITFGIFFIIIIVLVSNYDFFSIIYNKWSIKKDTSGEIRNNKGYKTKFVHFLKKYEQVFYYLKTYYQTITIYFSKIYTRGYYIYIFLRSFYVLNKIIKIIFSVYNFFELYILIVKDFITENITLFLENPINNIGIIIRSIFYEINIVIISCFIYLLKFLNTISFNILFGLYSINGFSIYLGLIDLYMFPFLIWIFKGYTIILNFLKSSYNYSFEEEYSKKLESNIIKFIANNVPANYINLKQYLKVFSRILVYIIYTIYHFIKDFKIGIKGYNILVIALGCIVLLFSLNLNITYLVLKNYYLSSIINNFSFIFNTDSIIGFKTIPYLNYVNNKNISKMSINPTEYLSSKYNVEEFEEKIEEGYKFDNSEYDNSYSLIYFYNLFMLDGVLLSFFIMDYFKLLYTTIDVSLINKIKVQEKISRYIKNKFEFVKRKIFLYPLISVYYCFCFIISPYNFFRIFTYENKNLNSSFLNNTVCYINEKTYNKSMLNFLKYLDNLKIEKTLFSSVFKRIRSHFIYTVNIIFININSLYDNYCNYFTLKSTISYNSFLLGRIYPFRFVGSVLIYILYVLFYFYKVVYYYFYYLIKFSKFYIFKLYIYLNLNKFFILNNEFLSDIYVLLLKYFNSSVYFLNISNILYIIFLKIYDTIFYLNSLLYIFNLVPYDKLAKIIQYNPIYLIISCVLKFKFYRIFYFCILDYLYISKNVSIKDIYNDFRFLKFTIFRSLIIKNIKNNIDKKWNIIHSIYFVFIYIFLSIISLIYKTIFYSVTVNDNSHVLNILFEKINTISNKDYSLNFTFPESEYNMSLKINPNKTNIIYIINKGYHVYFYDFMIYTIRALLWKAVNNCNIELGIIGIVFEYLL